MNNDKIEQVLDILFPLTCEEVRSELDSVATRAEQEPLTEHDHDVREHLLLCEECWLAFSETIDQLETRKQRDAEQLCSARQAALLLWGMAQMNELKRRAVAAGLRDSERVDPLWPRSVELAVLDDAGRDTGRSLTGTVLLPLMITPQGELRGLLRVDEPALVGWSTQCTVTFSAEAQETFAGVCCPTVDGQGLLIWLSALVEVRLEEPVLLPAQQVVWRLHPSATLATPERAFPDWACLLGLTPASADTGGLRVWVQPAFSPLAKWGPREAQGDFSSFAVDAGVRFGLLSDRDVFVLLFYVDLDGVVTRLLPGDLSDERHVHSGRPRFLPERMDEEWTISGPPGFDTIIAVATAQPLDVTNDLAALARTLARLPPEQWSVGYWQVVVQS